MGNFLDKTGLTYLWSKIKNEIAGKVSKSGDTMTGDLEMTAKRWIKTKDSSGFTYPMMLDNGTNMWIGSEKTATQHHTGAMYLSAGYNKSTSKGYATIYISVPNATNTNATNYGVYHTGNKPSKSDVGLANVDNTSDLNKPISTAMQEALDEKIGTDALDGVVQKSGDTMTGELIFEADSSVGTYGNFLSARRTDTNIEVGMGVGTAGTNHGVYSITQKKWLIYGNKTSIYTGALNVTSQATALTSLGLDVKEYGNADFTYNDGFAPYSTVANNTQEPRASKFGRTVNLTGSYKTTEARSDTSAFTLGKVPTGCEPLHDVRLRQQGTGQNSYLLVIDTAGNLKGERYGVGTNTAVGNNVWLNINATYISKS